MGRKQSVNVVAVIAWATMVDNVAHLIVTYLELLSPQTALLC